MEVFLAQSLMNPRALTRAQHIVNIQYILVGSIFITTIPLIIAFGPTARLGHTFHGAGPLASGISTE